MTLDKAQIVTFNLGKEEFALNIADIQEIIKMQPFTPVPLTPEYVEGVMNIRGNIIPVINLRIKMNFTKREVNSRTRIIVVNFENRRVGLIVDNMNEVVGIEPEKLQPPPLESADESESKSFEALYILEERIISILDIQKILELT